MDSGTYIEYMYILYIYTYIYISTNGIIHSNENQQTTTIHNKSHNDNVEQKRANIKEYIVYYFIYIQFTENCL